MEKINKVLEKYFFAVMALAIITALFLSTTITNEGMEISLPSFWTIIEPFFIGWVIAIVLMYTITRIAGVIIRRKQHG
ncbi:hypothetical protein CHH49_18045 [Terribacillus saccharophilus]|uniref:hypothetical protein n=1 Tax=Terribacillus saccharophilus TaxID=361277 RepID=UPI000BA5F772|nr:hypothetical protein [Terribacillus saccharophilus]PAF20071.1 hypothetical protein CHH49_18045 [Terribacillus saccharophilus]